MYKFVLYLYIILLSINIHAQEKGEITSFTPNDEVKIDNAPNFYASYFSEFQLSDVWNLRIEKRNQILAIGGNELVEYATLGKFKLTKTVSLFSGPQVDTEFNKTGEIINFSLRGVIGVEKKLTPSLLLNARYNTRIFSVSPSQNSELPRFNNISGFSLGSKIQF